MPPISEWLNGDLANLPGVSAKDIRDHTTKAAPFGLAEAMANSYKHHTRKPGTATARIRDTSVGPAGARVTIEVNWATPNASTVDALDLANDCVAAWRSFFKRFGIVEP